MISSDFLQAEMKIFSIHNLIIDVGTLSMNSIKTSGKICLMVNLMNN